MGAYQDKVKKLTFDPGVLFLAAVAEEHLTALASLAERMGTLEGKVAACCDGAGIRESVGLASEEKTLALEERIGKLEAKLPDLERRLQGLPASPQATEKTEPLPKPTES